MSATGSTRVPGRFDRSAEERLRPGLLDDLRADPTTRVLVVRGDRTPFDQAAPVFTDVASAGDVAAWAFLGRDADGRGILAAYDRSTPPDEGTWPVLRDVAATLTADDAGVLMPAIALGRWLLDAPYCPSCGTRLEVRAAGWAAHCPSCGREQFPRTDPAIIATITSASDPDLLLLGSKGLWGQGRYSCFAGFVEAGEALEETVVRELREEAGLDVGDLQYVGSQPWPYPRSLMVGFHTTALSDAAVPDGDEIVEVRWFTRAEIAAALAGEGDIVLPGPSAIAHRLIADWCGAPR